MIHAFTTGKSRRGVNRFGEGGTLAEESKLEKATQCINCDERVTLGETMLDASTNRCVSDFVHCDDLGLEAAMKQLMEATHDALVNMKGEILRMQYDLQKALVEISLLQQREELLQQQFKGKAFELEKEFSKKIEDLRQTVILEFTMCKHESEQSMLGKLESLLDEMRNIRNSDGKGDELIDSLPDLKFALERTQKVGQKSCDSNHSSITEISKAKTDDLHPSGEQRAALTEEMLQRISPKRLEQSVAVVRGWLQSPTPSECPSADRGKACAVKQQKQRHSNLPNPQLVCSLQEEAKLCPLKANKLPSGECERVEYCTKSSSQEAALQYLDIGSEESPTSSNSTPPLLVHNSMEILSPHKLKRPTVSERLWCGGFYKQNAAAALATVAHQRKELPAACPKQKVTTRQRRPALRILKPKNFKILDLLVSDSEDELGKADLAQS